MQSDQNIEEESISKRGKHIRSIRIVDKENTAPSHPSSNHRHVRQSSNANAPQTYHSRQAREKLEEQKQSVQNGQKRSISPHEFSFKKPTMSPFVQQQSSMLSQKLLSQEKEMQKLERMLRSMNSKMGVQQDEYNETRTQYEAYLQEKRNNQRLRQEIGELKELMKELLIEKQEQRMMGFYLE